MYFSEISILRVNCVDEECTYGITGVSAPVIPVAPSDAMYAIESRDAVIDAARFTSLTGWNPKITLEMGIRAMVHDLTVNS